MHLRFNFSAEVRIISGPVSGQQGWAWSWPKSFLQNRNNENNSCLHSSFSIHMNKQHPREDPNFTLFVNNNSWVCAFETWGQGDPAGWRLKAQLNLQNKSQFISRNQKISTCNQLRLKNTWISNNFAQNLPKHWLEVGKEVNIDTCWRERQSACV